MAGWLVLALLISADSNAVRPKALTHVRSAEPRVQELIAEGYRRSATFKAVADMVEGLSCLVYITSIVKLSDGMRGALLHGSAGGRELPVLRVLILTNLSPNEAIAVIAHELQHVVEAMTGAPGGGALAMSAAFDRLDPSARQAASRKYETVAAIGVTARVREELQRDRR